MKLDYQSLLRRLKKGEIAPVYLFSGNEEYLINSAINLIKKKLITEKESNLDLVYGDEANAEIIKEKISTVSMFENSKLVIVRNVDSLKEKEKKDLILFLNNTELSAYLILISSQIDTKDKLFLSISQSKNSIAVLCWPPFPNQVPGWIQERIREKGKKISPDNAKQLQELAGNSLSNLNNEIEKLIDYTGERQTIENNDIWEIISSGNMGNVFKLAEALGEKQINKAIIIFNQLKNNGEDFTGILSIILRHFRILWNIKELDEEGIDPLEMSQIAKIKPLFLKTYLGHIKNFSWDDLKNIYKQILDADYKIKTGIQSPEAAIESLMISFIG